MDMESRRLVRIIVGLVILGTLTIGSVQAADKYWALIVSGSGDMDTLTANTDYMYHVVSDHCTFDGVYYLAPDPTHPHVNAESTKTNVRSAITDWLGSRSDSHDIILIYASSHGAGYHTTNGLEGGRLDASGDEGNETQESAYVMICFVLNAAIYDLDDDGVRDDRVLDLNGDGYLDCDYNCDGISDGVYNRLIDLDGDGNDDDLFIDPDGDNLCDVAIDADTNGDRVIDDLTSDGEDTGTNNVTMDGITYGRIIGVDLNGNGDKSDWVGNDEYISLNNADWTRREKYWDDELAADLDTLDYEKLIFIRQGCVDLEALEKVRQLFPREGQSAFDQAGSCFGGGLIDDISAANRILITATHETTYSYGDGDRDGYSEWSEVFIDALHGENTHWENGTIYNEDPREWIDADTNNDGHVSMKEAFDYAWAHDDARPYETPWLDDDGNGLPTYVNGADQLDPDDGGVADGIWLPKRNQAPNTPSVPTGPDSGTPSTSYSFTATTTDPDGDRVAYNFHWGDDSESGWTSFVDSGSSASASHSWSSGGTYEVKVKAKDTNDAESGWSEAHTIVISRANQPPNTPGNPSPADGATNQSINVDLSWSGGDPDSEDTVTYDVYFKANDSNFGEPISGGQSGTTYDPGTLSYDTYYYWKIVATDNQGAFTEGPVWNFTTGSSGRHENETFSLPAGKWKMVSVPFTLDDPSPNAVLVDDLGSQNDAVWKLYRWNTANGSYDKYPYAGDFAPGKAFWIISRDAKEVDTGPGTDVSRQTDFVINLTSGWSQIGNPFPFSINWNEVRVRKNAEVVSISEAQARGWLRNKIWYWDGQSYLFYQAPSGILNPYEGYWVRALLDCEFLIPPTEAREAKAFAQVGESKEKFLQLKAKVGDLQDSYNFLGFSETAKDGYDCQDVEEAPPISPYISLFFRHLEWGKNKGDYTQDIRAKIPEAGLKCIWDFQVKTDQINQEIILEWENTSAFPEDLHLYLTDFFCNVLANMREKSSYRFTSPSGLESFKIIATSQAMPLPEDLGLTEVYSYPNPAHGKGARFHFYLASSAKVTIKMYSVSGELVRTLIEDEAYLPGVYEKFWKEDNDQGEKLARGVYIFIIQAGNPAKVISKSGKIVLLD